MDITKEELVELIKSTFTAMNAKTTTCDNDSTCEDGKVVVNQGNEPNEPSRPSTPCEPAGDEKSQNDEPSASDEPSTPEEPTTDDLSPKDVSQSETDKADDEKKDVSQGETAKAEEVIKEEVLNSAPTTSIPPVSENEEWRNLKGEAFRDWCSKHAEFCRNYKGE